MDLLQMIVNILLSGKQSEQLKQDQKAEIADIRRLLVSLNHAFSKMKHDYNRLSKYQQTLATLLADIEHDLQESCIISSDQAVNMPLWSSLEDGNAFYIMLKSILSGLTQLSVNRQQSGAAFQGGKPRQTTVRESYNSQGTLDISD